MAPLSHLKSVAVKEIQSGIPGCAMRYITIRDEKTVFPE